MNNTTNIRILTASVSARNGSLLQLKQKDGTELTGFLPKKLHAIELPQAPEFIEFTGETKEFTSGIHAGKTLFSIYKVNGQSWAKSEGGKGVNSAPKAPKVPKEPEESKPERSPELEQREWRIMMLSVEAEGKLQKLAGSKAKAFAIYRSIFNSPGFEKSYEQIVNNTTTVYELSCIKKVSATITYIKTGLGRNWQGMEINKAYLKRTKPEELLQFAERLKGSLIEAIQFISEKPSKPKEEAPAPEIKPEEPKEPEQTPEEEPAPAQEPEAPSEAQEEPKPVEIATEVAEEPETAPEEPKKTEEAQEPEAPKTPEIAEEPQRPEVTEEPTTAEEPEETKSPEVAEEEKPEAPEAEEEQAQTPEEEPEAPAPEIAPAPAIELETEQTDPIGAMLAMPEENDDEDPQDPQETEEAPAPEIKPELTDLAEINREIKKLRGKIAEDEEEISRREAAIKQSKRKIRDLVLKQREIEEAQKRKQIEEANKALEAAKKKTSEARKALEEAEAREEEARRKLEALNKKPEPNEDPEEGEDPQDTPEGNNGPDQAPESGGGMEMAPEPEEDLRTVNFLERTKGFDRQAYEALIRARSRGSLRITVREAYAREMEFRKTLRPEQIESRKDIPLKRRPKGLCRELTPEEYAPKQKAPKAKPNKPEPTNDGNEGGQSQNNGVAGNPGIAEDTGHALEGAKAADIAPEVPEAPKTPQEEPKEPEIKPEEPAAEEEQAQTPEEAPATAKEPEQTPEEPKIGQAKEPKAPKKAKGKKPKADRPKGKSKGFKDLEFQVYAHHLIYSDVKDEQDEEYRENEAGFIMDVWYETAERHLANLWKICNSEDYDDKEKDKRIKAWMKIQSPKNPDSEVKEWLDQMSNYRIGHMKLNEDGWSQFMAIVDQMLEAATDPADRKRWTKYLIKIKVKE